MLKTCWKYTLCLLWLIYSQFMLCWFPDPFLLEEESSQTVVIAVDVSRGCVNKYEELTAASTPCCWWFWGGLILEIKINLSKYNTELLGKPLQVRERKHHLEALQLVAQIVKYNGFQPTGIFCTVLNLSIQGNILYQ